MLTQAMLGTALDQESGEEGQGVFNNTWPVWYSVARRPFMLTLTGAVRPGWGSR